MSSRIKTLHLMGFERGTFFIALTKLKLRTRYIALLNEDFYISIESPHFSERRNKTNESPNFFK